LNLIHIEDKIDLSLNIDEEKKTGNILLRQHIDTDTNLGIMLGIEDKNIAGSGNILDANFQ
jgi:outer membrane protein assembly factor BamA